MSLLPIRSKKPKGLPSKVPVRLSYPFRLSMTLLLVVSVITLLTGVLSYTLFTRTLKTTANESSIQLLNQSGKTLSVILQKMEHKLISLSVKRQLLHVSGKRWDVRRDIGQLTALIDVFHELTSSSMYVHSVYYYDLLGDSIVSDNGLQVGKYFFDRDFVEKLIESNVEAGWTAPRELTPDIEPHPVTRSKVFSFVLEVPLVGSARLGYLVLNLRYDLISRAVDDLNFHQGQTVYLFDNKQRLFFAQDQRLADLLSKRLTARPADLPQENSWAVEELGGKRYLITVVGFKGLRERDTGWKYLSLIPVDSFYSDYGNVVKNIFLVSSLCLLCGLLMTVFVVHRYSLPVQHLLHSLAEIDADWNDRPDGHTYRNEFSYFDHFVLELKGRIDKNALLVRNYHLSNLLVGGYQEGGQSDTDASDLGAILRASHFVVLVVSLRAVEAHSETERDEVRKWRHYEAAMVCEELTKEAPNASYLGEVVQQGTGRIAVVLGFREPCEEDVVLQLGDQAAEQIAAALTERLDRASFVIGIGGVYTTFRDIHISHEEAVEACRWFRPAHPESKIVRFRDLKGKRTAKQYLIGYERRKNNLVAEIKRGDRRQAETMLNEVLRIIITEDGITPPQKNFMLLQLANALILPVIELNGSYEEVLGHDGNPYFELSTIQWEEELRAWFNQLLDRVMQFYRISADRVNENMVQEVQNYVATHYHDVNLTLQAVADHVGLHVSYFCTLFKQYSGKTFNEYLMRLRFDKACENMRTNGSDTLLTVAQETGFGNVRNMTRAFKKFCGETPSIYRRRRYNSTLSGE